MGIIISSADAAIRELDNYILDLAYGSDENDFELTCDPASAPPLSGYISIDGTDYGGTVDSVAIDTSTGLVSASGRTWHGILAGKRLLPDTGESHLSVSGEVGAVLDALISRMGLDELFVAEENTKNITYTFERFCDGYSGICSMLKANNLKLCLSARDGLVYMSALAVATLDSVDSDLMDFMATECGRRTNHLVCAGAGENEERIVIHLYADIQGNVSETQSLFGVDEVTAFYDYTTAEEAELREQGIAKLEELQGEGSISLSIHDGIGADIGDIICAYDEISGRRVSAEVTKKIVKVEDGCVSISYEVGDTSVSTGSISGGSEGSSGGHAYYAGSGLTLSNWTFGINVGDGLAIDSSGKLTVASTIKTSNAWVFANKAIGNTTTTSMTAASGWQYAKLLNTKLAGGTYTDYFSLTTSIATITFKKAGYYRIKAQVMGNPSGRFGVGIFNASTEVASSTIYAQGVANTVQVETIRYLSAGATLTLKVTDSVEATSSWTLRNGGHLSNCIIEYLGE